MANQCAVARAPPVAGEKAGHHAVPTAAVPDERAAGAEDARELAEHALVVGRAEKEAERCEQVDHSIECTGPTGRHRAHVATHESQPRARAAAAGPREEDRGVIEASDIESGLRQEMRMPPLSTWHVEHSRAHWELENLEQSRDFPAIALRREERGVLEQVTFVEMR